MPELPEVEVTRLGIEPHIQSQRVQKILIHQPQMRWPVPEDVKLCEGQIINKVTRRAKYLFIHFDLGSIIFHLGMSGKMRVVDASTVRKKHDHIELFFDNSKKLVLNDPRRFGCCLWQSNTEKPISILQNLGPEPLSEDFHDKVLFEQSRNRTQAVKNFIMDNTVVVGVGNIYANESLFRSGIDPRRAAGKVSFKRYQKLTKEIKLVLAKAIEQGGTTLRDFAQADGNPGYFSQHLYVYGRNNEPCEVCSTPIRSLSIGQRNSFFCIKCQR